MLFGVQFLICHLVLRAAIAFCFFCVTCLYLCCSSTGYQFIYYSPENTAKAKEVLSNINQLQPLIATHADLLLNSASQHSPDSLKNSLKMLSEKVRSKSLLTVGKVKYPNPHGCCFLHTLPFIASGNVK